jgi:siderophore synthetase component
MMHRIFDGVLNAQAAQKVKRVHAAANQRNVHSRSAICVSRFKYYLIFCGVGAISDTLAEAHASSDRIISGYGGRPHPGLF